MLTLRLLSRSSRPFLSRKCEEDTSRSLQHLEQTSPVPSTPLDSQKPKRNFMTLKPKLRMPWKRKRILQTVVKVTLMSNQYFHESSNAVLPQQGEETPLSALKEVTEVESAPVELPKEVGTVLNNQERGLTAVDHATRLKKLKSKLRWKKSGIHENAVRMSKVKFAFRIDAAVGDSLAPLPGIKGAAGIALEIINIAETVKTNTRDAQSLVESAEGLLHIMNNSPMIVGASEAIVPLYIRDFQIGLASIIDIMKTVTLTNIPWYKKIFCAERDKARIADFSRLLSQHVERFKMRMSLGHMEALRDQSIIMNDAISLLKRNIMSERGRKLGDVRVVACYKCENQPAICVLSASTAPLFF